MANERFTTEIHVPPTIDPVPVSLGRPPRSRGSVYIKQRWGSSCSEARRALHRVDQEKGRGQSVAILRRTKTQNNSAIRATDGRGPWDIAFGDSPVTVGGLTRAVVTILKAVPAHKAACRGRTRLF